MLSIRGQGCRLCDGITRREVLRVGGLGFTGLLWSDWLRSRGLASQSADAPKKSSQFGKAKACILIFNYGGPSHLDIWDLKPDAPTEIRGEFKPAATKVPGMSITEHLPLLGSIANQYAIIRSVNHIDNDHAVGTYLALTGYPHPRSRPLGTEPAASALDMPSLGSVVSKLHPPRKPVFSYVTLGLLRHFGNSDSMGQNAGCLGKIYDPFAVPKGALDTSGVRAVLSGDNGQNLTSRRSLLEQINLAAPALEATAATQNLDGFGRRAFELLASPASRHAFDLEKEPQKIRDLYGPTPLAQNCLLARRLVEAGVPLVTVYSAPERDWDTHGDNFNLLKKTLLPSMDRSTSALLKDLEGRGLLDETLVVWMGDMGRTPLINKAAGRDHWSFCYSIVLAGAGVRGGQVFGASDRRAAYPSTNPVSPQDVAATIYRCLGIDPETHVTDQQGRPFAVCTGKPIDQIFG
jgi:hypothetical protein